MSPESEEMGPLPAWRGERVHVALPLAAPSDRPEQLWVGIPHGATQTSFSVTGERLDGPGLARFSSLSCSSLEPFLDVVSGMRTAAGYPPHWVLAVEISDPGCWAITITTDDGVADTVIVDLAFNSG